LSFEHVLIYLAIKSIALSTAFDFESFIEKAKDPLLQVLFSGGVIRNKKLQRGTILQLNSASSKDFNAGEQIFSVSQLIT
jgi:hypothetical protein